ncbi:uncharacterized protein LOC132724312 [Ruditapes philippinarum]|uniref:uncharacterized protein LOC132724312 n=1 Tax=Ruditapes philippinarum TaxID=129788 RepID=UPI00295B7FA8|nr:uncharacterized protein LOC132724312 [Ruditapes philippinarum]
MVGQLLKEEKEFGVLLDKTFTSPEVDVTQKLVPSRDTMTSYHTEVKHCGARVQPRQTHSREQEEVANEDKMDVYGRLSSYQIKRTSLLCAKIGTMHMSKQITNS